MYAEHFGLRELPFALTPDTAYAFASASQRTAFNDLQIALAIGEGFVKVVGEVGTGKTLLCRRVLSRLPRTMVTAYVPNPALTPRTLLLSLCWELGLSVAQRSTEFDLRVSIEKALITHRAAGRRVILLIDEAQTMPMVSLECVRLLSNLETEKHKLIQVVLFGQPELDRRLARREARQLRQRIAFSVNLQPMTDDEVGKYLEHRMRVAGFSGERAFSHEATRTITWASKGVPRLVNVLAHKSLMLAYGRGERSVGVAACWGSARDTADARSPKLFALPSWAGRPMLATLNVIR